MNTLCWTARCYLEEDSGESLDEWNSLDSATAPGDPEQHVSAKLARVNGRIIIFEFFLSFHLRIESGVSSVCAVCRYQPRGWLLPKPITRQMSLSLCGVDSRAIFLVVPRQNPNFSLNAKCKT